MNAIIVLTLILFFILSIICLWYSTNVKEYMTPVDNDSLELQALIPKTVVDERVLETPVDPSDFLVLITAQCMPYHDFQSLAAHDRIKEVWPEAQVIRLLHCSDTERTTYKYKDIVPSIYTSNCSIHPRTGDNYAPLNRPVAIQEFFEQVPVETIKQNFIVVIDADIILNRRLNYFPIAKGAPVGQIAHILVPKMYSAAQAIWPDATLYPKLPLFDMGCPYILHKDDLAALAPWWVKFTNMLRENSMSKEKINWICEMYSYVFAAAQVGLVHNVRDDLQARWPFDNKKPVAAYHYDLCQKDEATGHDWSKRHYMHDILVTDELMTPKVIPNDAVKTVLDSINKSLINYREKNKQNP